MAKVGRPKKEIDYKIVEAMANVFCTQIEIASQLDLNVRTLLRDKEFCHIYNKGIETAKASLRRTQYKKANEGNATMLIWLGKQYLGQSDKTETTNDGLKEAVDKLNNIYENLSEV